MQAIFVVLLQALFTLGAGWLLWKIWRRLSAISPRAGVLIGAGLIIRALLAQVMFWISYLHLPIARSLQDGEGFWTLAIDGRLYSDFANALLSQGWAAVALVDKRLPSPAFLQILAVFQSLFGSAASVGALLNLFAYLGTCAAILRLSRTADGRLSTPALIAIAAFSFAPAVIIWSVQPLKDPFFIFMIAAFVAACTMWQEAWRQRFSVVRFLVPLLLMLVVLYAVVGIRWYFGLLFWVASVPYFAAAAWRSNRRVLAAVTNAAVFVALSQVIALGAGNYVPRQLLIDFGFNARVSERTIAETVVQSRQNFDAVHGNTMIESGTALREVDTSTPERPRQIAHRSRALKQIPAPALPQSPPSLPTPVATATQAPEPPRTEANVAQTPPSTVEIAPKTVIAAPVQPSPAPVPVAVALPPVTRPEAPDDEIMPKSTFARITAGLTAILLPHFIAERLGLIHVGGGRGLWVIVETDTLFFDGLLLVVLYYVFRALPRGAWRNPSFWLVAISTAGVTILLAYTVSNFGTLFRHRGMILISLCLQLVVARDMRPSADRLQEDLIAES